VKQLKKISKMEEKQKSAVEFLESQYHFNKQLSARDFKEAKEMEGSQATMKTAVEKIIAEIDNEVDFLKTHQYIAEVRGRMIGLAFAKRVALELKEMEKEQIIEFACDVYDLNYGKDKSFRKQAEDFYNKTFKNK